MSDGQDIDAVDAGDEDDLPKEDELEVLKQRASLMGVKFHPSIGLPALREKVNAAVLAKGKPAAEVQPVAFSDSPLPVFGTNAPIAETEPQRRARKKREAGELIRIRITCMNPAKSEWDGEIFTVSNSVVGTFKKFVPFLAEDGWHVPRLMLNMIQMRQCQIFVTARDERGNQVKRSKLIKEFAVEILPSLTPAELQDLAQRQAMAGKIG